MEEIQHLRVNSKTPDDLLESIEHILDLADEKKYSFHSFRLDELYSVNKNALGLYKKDEMVILYSERKFGLKEAEKYIDSLIKSLKSYFGAIKKAVSISSK